MERQKQPYILDHNLSYSEMQKLPMCSNCKHADGMRYRTDDYKPKEGFNGYCRLHKEYIDQVFTKLQGGFYLEGRTHLDMDCNDFALGGPSKFFGGIAGFFGG